MQGFDPKACRHLPSFWCALAKESPPGPRFVIGGAGWVGYYCQRPGLVGKSSASIVSRFLAKKNSFKEAIDSEALEMSDDGLVVFVLD